MPTMLRSGALRFFFYSLETPSRRASMSKAGTLRPSIGSNLWSWRGRADLKRVN
jgi:hypothetical protein